MIIEISFSSRLDELLLYRGGVVLNLYSFCILLISLLTGCNDEEFEITFGEDGRKFNTDWKSEEISI